MTVKDIQRLDPTKPFAEFFGLKPNVDHAVRILAFDKHSGKFVGVFQPKEFRKDPETGKMVSRDRPPGWAMPGGMVEPNESPAEFIKRREAHKYGEQEYGEIRWEIDEASILPLYIDTKGRDKGSRLEYTHYFFAAIDINRPISITPEEGEEVTMCELFDIQDIFNAPTVDTQDTSPENMEPHPKRGEFYGSHIGHYHRAWKIWQNLRERQWREEQAAKAPAAATTSES